MKTEHVVAGTVFFAGLIAIAILAMPAVSLLLVGLPEDSIVPNETVQAQSVQTVSPEEVAQYKAGAEEGDELKQLELGLLYANGNGVPKDAAKAFYWLSLSAGQGEPTAQFWLGRMYAAGNGVKKSHQTAYMWMDISARLFPWQSRIQERDEIGQGLTPRQRTATQERSMRCESSNYTDCGLESSNAGAQLPLTADRARALSLDQVRARAEQGELEAQQTLAHRYRYGSGGTPRDLDEAIRWAYRCATQGNSACQFDLSMMFEDKFWLSGAPPDWTLLQRAYMWMGIVQIQHTSEFGKPHSMAERHLDAMATQDLADKPGALAEAEAQTTRCLVSNFTDCGGVE